jgi:hypothetical protein
MFKTPAISSMQSHAKRINELIVKDFKEPNSSYNRRTGSFEVC